MSAEVGIAILTGLGTGLGILAIFFVAMKLIKRKRVAKPREKVQKETAQESPFQLGDLVITPTEAKQGERVSISFRVSNISNNPVVVRRAVKVNGVEIGKVDLELAPGESQRATFFVEENTPGEYKVEVGDLAGSFVVSPPKLSVNAMDINPRKVKEGGKVEIAAEVANTGGTTATGKLEVRLRGNVLLSKEITIPAGRIEKVSASLSDLEPGIYEVKLDHFKDSFVVQMSDSFETL